MKLNLSKVNFYILCKKRQDFATIAKLKTNRTKNYCFL